MVISDSAFDTSGQSRLQHGWIVGYTTPELAQGLSAPLSLASWKSRRLRRKAGSSLLCEALSGTKAVSNLLWIANLDMSMRVTGHRHGDPLNEEFREPPTVLTRQSRRNQDPAAQMVMGAKALYDSLMSEQTNQDDQRACLEVSIIKEDFQVLGCVPRWVPHDKNPSDALTKAEGAHAMPLINILKTSRFKIRAEAEELEERKEIKQEYGYVPRPRHQVRTGKASQFDFHECD